MATEVFLQPELEEIVIDADKKNEWEEKIMSLGLEGQLHMTNNSEKGSASPYTHMNKHMVNVFEILCPTKVAVEKYNKTQIPIEVLSHIALCKQEGYFQKIEVWYDNMNPDPILVGYVTDSWSNPVLHIVARWGDEIIPFEQLVEKAIRRMAETYKNYAEHVITEARIAKDAAESRVKQFIYGGKSIHAIQIDASLSITNRDLDMPF